MAWMIWHGITLKQVPFVLRQTTHTYSESWGPVENFLHSFITQNPVQRPSPLRFCVPPTPL